ncbi:site-specific integrase [Halorubrum sp. RMP-47]|uniref:Site-specific integrase n=1 Tax=Halorubrum miltondacostae TaxID=3076378 RepID=A0ABD5LYX4_9EURY
MSKDNTGSDRFEEPDVTEQRKQFADAFDRPTDPLLQYNDIFADLSDPFDYFLRRVVTSRDEINKGGTIEDYERTYQQWREFMSTTDRHPACPSVQHVKAYIAWRRDVHNNAPSTIKIKFGRLKQAYSHWQRESVFPHPHDYNPFEIAYAEASFGESNTKTFPDLKLTDLRSVFDSIKNIRERALIGLQLKLGLRAGEVFNLLIEDIHLSHSGVQECYPKLGSNMALGEYSDVLYVPPDRDGNKSSVPRLLPIDEELRWLLIRHLLTRPQVDEPWVFLSTRSFRQLGHDGINGPWKAAFHPQYAETEAHRAITSHFGRHWFSSYLRLEAEFTREHVQYMRGDQIEPLDEFAEAIDDYLHPHYEHIEREYRNEIFKIDLL